MGSVFGMHNKDTVEVAQSFALPCWYIYCYPVQDFCWRRNSYLWIILQVFCYALSRDDGTEWRQRIKGEAEHFTDVSAMPSDMIAKVINEDKIQILINLNGYTKVVDQSSFNSMYILPFFFEFYLFLVYWFHCTALNFAFLPPKLVQFPICISYLIRIWAVLYYSNFWLILEMPEQSYFNS